MRIRCTACSALLQVADEVAGKRIRCPRCREATVATPAPVAKARPQAAAVRAASPAARPRKIADEDDDEETPKPRKKKKKKRKKDNTPLIVGVAVSGGAAVCIAIIAVVLVLSRPAAVDAPPQVAQAKEHAEPGNIALRPQVDRQAIAQVNAKAAAARDEGLGKIVEVPFDAPPEEPKKKQREKPKDRGDDTKRIEVPVVESIFKLPDISEAEWFEQGEIELKGTRRTLGEAYEKIGHKDAKWDEPARRSLELAAQMYTKNKKQAHTPNHKDVYPLVTKAIDAGCDDPLILYLRARTANGVEKVSAEESLRRHEQAAEAMRGSKHSPYRRLNAFLYAAIAHVNAGGPDQIEKAKRFYADALDALVESVKEERNDPVVGSRFAHTMLELRLLGARLESNSFVGYQKVDQALQKAAKSEVFRQKLRGEFMVSYAWEARGGGVAATVGQDQFKLFHERLLDALKALTRAWELDPTDASTAATAITVLKGLGAEQDDIKVWFDRAMNADPGCLAACDALIDFLDPKWGGNAPELIAFGRECAKSKLVRTGIPLLLGEAHLRIVIREEHQIATAYVRQPEVWKEISDVFDAHFEAVPSDPQAHGVYAIYCAYAGRNELARQHFEKAPGSLKSMIFNASHLRWAREVAGLKKE
jgi:catechol 2,3-dioxygenase-like lactoylglutathione lyase family enzyme